MIKKKPTNSLSYSSVDQKSAFHLRELTLKVSLAESLSGICFLTHSACCQNSISCSRIWVSAFLLAVNEGHSQFIKTISLAPSFILKTNSYGTSLSCHLSLTHQESFSLLKGSCEGTGPRWIIFASEELQP